MTLEARRTPWRDNYDRVSRTEFVLLKGKDTVCTAAVWAPERQYLEGRQGRQAGDSYRRSRVFLSLDAGRTATPALTPAEAVELAAFVRKVAAEARRLDAAVERRERRDRENTRKAWMYMGREDPVSPPIWQETP